MAWKPIKTAPKNGKPFLAWHEGEIFVARFTPSSANRRAELCYRTHKLHTPSQHVVIDATYQGKKTKAYVPVNEPWPETFQHNWTLWERGFDFKPTKWAPLPR